MLREGAIAAGLTAMMILLFLGSWRSTVVVMISIPLAILTSLVLLYFLGETLNTMTLGGLALAVGILVDDSTVTIENTHRLLTEEQMPLPEATLHGAAGIAVPTLVSTLAISCVFTSVVFLDGPAKYLFTPLGLAVVFAMLASYGLSRTLTPITIGLLLKSERHGSDDGGSAGLFSRVHRGFERGFERLRGGYASLLTSLLRRKLIVPIVAALVLALAVAMLLLVGRDFFPAIDGGQIQLHVRAPAGTRIESTERIFQAVEDKIREVIPESERQMIVDNIGLPARAYNLAFTDGSTIGVNDGVILVALKEGHAPTADYVRQLRQAPPAAFPDVTFYFQAADIVTQILNFGLPAQIDVRTVGYDRKNNLRVARELRQRIAAIPESRMRTFSRRSTRRRSMRRSIVRERLVGTRCEHHRHQYQCEPELIGTGYAKFLDRPDIGNSLLSGGPDAGAQCQLVERSRQYAGFVGDRLRRCSGCAGTGSAEQRGDAQARQRAHQCQPDEHSAGLRGLRQCPRARPRQRVQPDQQDRCRSAEAALARKLDPVIGQIQSMNDAFWNLGIGLLFASVFVYLLMVVNYQNFGDPFVVILALPARSVAF